MKYFMFPCIMLFLVMTNLMGQTHQSCVPLSWNGSLSPLNQTFSSVDLGIPDNIHNRVNYLLDRMDLRIRIAIEEDGVFPYGSGDNLDYTVLLNGAIYDVVNNTTTAFSQQVINLSDQSPESVYLLNLQLPLGNSLSKNPYGLAVNTNTIFRLTNLTIEVANNNTNISIPNSQLKIEICSDLDIKSDVVKGTYGLPHVIPAYPSSLLSSNNSAHYKFEWLSSSFPGTYFPHYEFQLLKLENTEYPLKAPDQPNQDEWSSNEYKIKTKLDWSKALTFLLPEETLEEVGGTYSYTIKPSQGRGYYLWRVRPIGNYFEGGVANNQNWGIWSRSYYTNYVNSGMITLGAVSASLTLAKDIIFYEDPDEPHNYIYSRTFTEDGQVYESMTYADKLLRPRQTQSYLPAEDKTIVGQTLYDHLGRSSIAVIPVPVNDEMHGYKTNFVQTIDGATGNEVLYTAEHFATDETVYNPQEIVTTGAYKYYSDDNLADLTIPDAEGYPFTRTLYSRDGLNRVTEQSGIGKNHMVGDIADGRGRTTKTKFQVGVDDAELVSVFGMEAPDPKHVTKQTVIDPNGTTSVTYLSKTGKVLATALANPLVLSSDPKPAQLEPLDFSLNNVLDISEPLDLGKFRGGSFVSRREVEFLQDIPATDLTFDYTPPGCGTTASGLPTCLGSAACSYDVSVEIVKLYTGVDDPLFDLVNNPSMTEVVVCSTTTPFPTSGCNTPVNVLPDCISLLTKGTYRITKHVTPTASFQPIIDLYLSQTQSEMAAYATLIAVILDGVTEEADWTHVGTAVGFIHNYLTVGSTVTPTDLMNQLNGIAHYSSQPFLHPPQTDYFVTSFFQNLTKFVVDDIIYIPSSTSTVDPRSVARIDLIVHDCDNNSIVISSEIDNKKERFSAGQGAIYSYNDIDYAYPPFVEYFLDEVGLDVFNNPNQTATAINTIFLDFFDGYKYWSGMSNQWEPIDAVNFVSAYESAITATVVDENALKVLNANQFNRMIWHMLKDEYFSGEIRFVDAADPNNSNSTSPIDEYQRYDEVSETWIVVDVNNLSAFRSTQYEFGELRSCWRNVFGGMKKMLELQGQIISQANSMSADIDATVNDALGSGAYEDQVNQHTPWILKLFFGTDLQNKMTNDVTNNGVQPDFSNIGSKLNPTHLPKQFLECAGYNYARIIDPAFGGVSNYSSYESSLPVLKQQGTIASINYNTYDIPLNTVDGSGLGHTSIPSGGYQPGGPGTPLIPGYSGEMEEYYGVNSGGNERVAHTGAYTSHTFSQFPFVQNPVFAFKYYEYWGRTGANSFTHPWDGDFDKIGGLGHQLNVGPNTLDKPLSCLMCEDQYNYEIDGSTCNSSLISHDQWSSESREGFVGCVEFMSNGGDLPQTDEIVVQGNIVYINVDPSNGSCIELPNAEQTTMVNNCETNCDNRRDEFRADVIQMFETACYAVGQCEQQAPDNYVTMAEVDAIVDKLIEDCKTYCDLTISSNEVQCMDAGGVHIYYCDVQIGNLCELGKRDIAYNWDVELFVAPAPGCPNNVPPTGTIQPCPGGTANETEVKDISAP